ncbi:MAG: hypothetical protein HDT05_03400 [Bacteroidales bacterium]|nr:hypothetical protein [Bacteroidales bacterium]
MNTLDTEIKRWGIVVIQSIPKGQPQTGTQLYEDLLRYKPIMDGNIFCELIDVYDTNDFESAFSKILSKLEEGDILTIHVEAHGSDDGIALSSGEIVKWKEFYDLIRPINIALGHLLLIVMAMCKSIAMISDISIEQRAPYRAFICTTREMYPDELYEGFLSFYEKFCNLLDVFGAMTALQKEILDENGRSPFQLLSAEAVFEETLSSTRNIDDLCVNQLNRMVRPITQENLERMRGQIRELLVELQSKYSDYYNFRDLY